VATLERRKGAHHPDVIEAAAAHEGQRGSDDKPDDRRFVFLEEVHDWNGWIRPNRGRFLAPPNSPLIDRDRPRSTPIDRNRLGSTSASGEESSYSDSTPIAVRYFVNLFRSERGPRKLVNANPAASDRRIASELAPLARQSATHRFSSANVMRFGLICRKPPARSLSKTTAEIDSSNSIRRQFPRSKAARGARPFRLRFPGGSPRRIQRSDMRWIYCTYPWLKAC
jgi:hypothetical protein